MIRLPRLRVGNARKRRPNRGPTLRVLVFQCNSRFRAGPSRRAPYTAAGLLFVARSSRAVACSWTLGFAAATFVGAAGYAQPLPGEPTIRLHGVVTQNRGGWALLQFGDGRPLALRQGASHRGFVVRAVAADGVQLETADGRRMEVRWADRDADGTPLVGEALPAAGEALPAAGEALPAAGGAPGVLRAAASGVESPNVASPEGESPTLEVGPDRSGAELEPPRPAHGAGAASGSSLPASRVAAQPGRELRLSRDDVRLRLQSELPRILAGAVVAPRVEGRDVVGLELVSFPVDTVLGETGLVPGDVLLAVNGRAVRGAESLAVLIQRFQTASRIELTVDRAGAVFPLRYRFE